MIGDGGSGGLIGKLEELVAIYRCRVKDLRHCARQCRSDAKLYKVSSLGRADELEQCAIEIEKIVNWYRKKRGLEYKERRQTGQLRLFEMETSNDNGSSGRAEAGL